MRWLGLASVVGFVVLGCSGAPSSGEEESIGSVSSAAVKCAQSRFYSSVPVEWTHLGLCLRDPVTFKYNCRSITQTIVVEVSCGNACEGSAELVCTFADPEGGTHFTPVPASKPDFVSWEACNSANVCEDDPSHPPRPGTGLPGTNLP